MDSVLIGVYNEFVQPIIWLLFGVATIVFIWGLIEMSINSDGSEGRKKGGQHILWGIIGLAVMVSAFGILELIKTTLTDDLGAAPGDVDVIKLN